MVTYSACTFFHWTTFASLLRGKAGTSSNICPLLRKTKRWNWKWHHREKMLKQPFQSPSSVIWQWRSSAVSFLHSWSGCLFCARNSFDQLVIGAVRNALKSGFVNLVDVTQRRHSWKTRSWTQWTVGKAAHRKRGTLERRSAEQENKSERAMKKRRFLHVTPHGGQKKKNSHSVKNAINK